MCPSIKGRFEVEIGTNLLWNVEIKFSGRPKVQQRIRNRNGQERVLLLPLFCKHSKPSPQGGAVLSFIEMYVTLLKTSMASDQRAI